jgi:two-component system, NtrC family, nitrogen regulation response regulator NtrX
VSAFLSPTALSPPGVPADGIDRADHIDLEIADAAAAAGRVLIWGTTGSANSRIAQLIHLRSARAEAAFVSITCVGASDVRLDAEISGIPMLRAGTTVLLNGVAQMGPHIQNVLFAMLDKLPPGHIRLMTTTTRNLYEDVVAGRFRADLFYRLNSICVGRPPAMKRRTPPARA